MPKRRDRLAGDWRHANTIRAIHGLEQRELCPKCSVPISFERDIEECGGRTVRECKRCDWNDFDEQQQAHVESLADDPGFSDY